MSTLSPADLVLLRAAHGDRVTPEDAALALFPELAFTFHCTVSPTGRLELFQSREARNASLPDDAPEAVFTLDLTEGQRAILIDRARLALLAKAYPRTDAQEVA
jgi:hypothetical protein